MGNVARALSCMVVVACGGGGSQAAPDGAVATADACVPTGSTPPYVGQIVFTYSLPSTYAVTAAFTTSPACPISRTCTAIAGQCCYLAHDTSMSATPVSAGAITIESTTTLTRSGTAYPTVTNPPT